MVTSFGQACRAAVQAYATTHPNAKAIDIARMLPCTEAEALAGLSQGVYHWSATALPDILADIRTWGQVMVLVRNHSAVAELTVPADQYYVKNNWLNWIDESYNLHLNLQATHHILGLIRPGKTGQTYSFNLVDEPGQVFCRFYARTPQAIDQFLARCQG